MYQLHAITVAIFLLYSLLDLGAFSHGQQRWTGQPMRKQDSYYLEVASEESKRINYKAQAEEKLCCFGWVVA